MISLKSICDFYKIESLEMFFRVITFGKIFLTHINEKRDIDSVFILLFIFSTRQNSTLSCMKGIILC